MSSPLLEVSFLYFIVSGANALVDSSFLKLGQVRFKCPKGQDGRKDMKCRHFDG